MRRVHFALAGGAALAFLVSLSGQWWEILLPTGGELAVTGWSASPLASALVVAWGAAFAAGLLTRGIPRRIIAILQIVLGLGVLASWWSVLQEPVASQGVAITALTGLTGELSLEGVRAGAASVWVWVGVAAASLAAASGGAGVLASDVQSGRSRYERANPGTGEDPIDTWDALSEGTDPTNR